MGSIHARDIPNMSKHSAMIFNLNRVDNSTMGVKSGILEKRHSLISFGSVSADYTRSNDIRNTCSTTMGAWGLMVFGISAMD